MKALFAAYQTTI